MLLNRAAGLTVGHPRCGRLVHRTFIAAILASPRSAVAEAIMHRWVVIAAIALGTSGHACAQTPGYYDTRDAFYAAEPPGYYLPPPVTFAPPWYFSRPVDPYLPRTGYLPPAMRIDVSPGLVEVMPPRPRSCG